jgi:hypothetical protein
MFKKEGDSYSPTSSYASEKKQSQARANALRVFPELTHYQWQDDYFHDSEHDILAVIIHDELVHVMDQLAKAAMILGVLSFFMIPVCAIVLANIILVYVFIGIFILCCMPQMVVWLAWPFCQSLYPPPHTAVTSNALIHVPGKTFWSSTLKGTALLTYIYQMQRIPHLALNSSSDSFVIPFSDIVEVTELRIVGNGEGRRSALHALIKLTNTISHYRDGAVTAGPIKEELCEITLRDMENPLFLQKLIMTLKSDSATAQDDVLDLALPNRADLAMSEREAINEASIDELPSSSILPELDTYEWQDTHFDESEHNIVAAFDSDLIALAARRAHIRCARGCVFGCCVAPMGIAFMTAAILFQSWIMVIILSAHFVLATSSMGMYNTFDAATPHLAVTTQGVACELEHGTFSDHHPNLSSYHITT